MTALGAAAAVLPWVQYQQILGQYLRLMARRTDGPSGKAVVRAVCAILDALPRFLAGGEEDAEEGREEGAAEDGGVGGGAAAAAAGAQAAGELEEPEAGVAAVAEEEEEGGVELMELEEAELDLRATCTTTTTAHLQQQQQQQQPAEGQHSSAPSAAVVAAEARRLLAARVLPELRRQLVVGEVARPPVALAMVRVLRLLPEAAVRVELPRTLQKVANLLKSRLQRIRSVSWILFSTCFLPYWYEVWCLGAAARGCGHELMSTLLLAPMVRKGLCLLLAHMLLLGLAAASLMCCVEFPVQHPGLPPTLWHVL